MNCAWQLACQLLPPVIEPGLAHCVSGPVEGGHHTPSPGGKKKNAMAKIK
jgi:hypothetical protein